MVGRDCAVVVCPLQLVVVMVLLKSPRKMLSFSLSVPQPFFSRAIPLERQIDRHFNRIHRVYWPLVGQPLAARMQ